MTEKWKCTVCGYVHEGLEPPATCPLCGADRSQFIPLEEETVNLLRDMLDSFLLHPAAAHFPNGLLPTAVLFLVLTLFTGSPYFEHAVFFLLGVALAVVPVSMASGIYDWRTKFRGIKAKIFYKKIGLAATLLLLGMTALGIRFLQPEVMGRGGGLKWVYSGILLAMLAVTALLGHYGGKLSFQWKKRNL